jgi:hypothetical protein
MGLCGGIAEVVVASDKPQQPLFATSKRQPLEVNKHGQHCYTPTGLANGRPALYAAQSQADQAINRAECEKAASRILDHTKPECPRWHTSHGAWTGVYDTAAGTFQILTVPHGAR